MYYERDFLMHLICSLPMMEEFYLEDSITDRSTGFTRRKLTFHIEYNKIHENTTSLITLRSISKYTENNFFCALPLVLCIY